MSELSSEETEYKGKEYGGNLARIVHKATHKVKISHTCTNTFDLQHSIHRHTFPRIYQSQKSWHFSLFSAAKWFTVCQNDIHAHIYNIICMYIRLMVRFFHFLYILRFLSAIGWLVLVLNAIFSSASRKNAKMKNMLAREIIIMLCMWLVHQHYDIS